MPRRSPDHFNCDGCGRFMDYHAIHSVRIPIQGSPTGESAWHQPSNVSLGNAAAFVCSLQCRAIEDLKRTVAAQRKELDRLWKLH